jgi:hypothetical protein
MKDILIRSLEEDLVAALDNAATLAGLSREEYLRGELARIAGATLVPRFGHGLRAFTPTGGTCVLKALGAESAQVQGGAQNLSQSEMEAFRRAKLLAAPANGGRWAAARQVLEQAGFEIFAE